MTNPKVSVAIGTWNRFNMVCEAIDAALDQTYPIDEIIVFDDCSPDSSYEKLQTKYAGEKRVKVFHQEKNTGGVPNWNSAINKCCGDYIAWCSDDDRFFKKHIEKSIKFLEDNKDIDLIQAEFATIYESGAESIKLKIIDETILQKCETYSPRFNKPYRIHSKNIFDYYIRNFSWPFHPSTFVFRKELWTNVGEFDPKYQLADSDWYLRVSKNHKIAFLQHIGVLNRRHSGNWSTRMGTTNMQTEFFEMVYKYLAYPEFSLSKSHQNQQEKRWRNFEFLLLLRIFISKKRRGYVIEAEKTKILITQKFYAETIKMIILNSVKLLTHPFKYLNTKNDLNDY